jgi:hypothetical protein
MSATQPAAAKWPAMWPGQQRRDRRDVYLLVTSAIAKITSRLSLPSPQRNSRIGQLISLGVLLEWTLICLCPLISPYLPGLYKSLLPRTSRKSSFDGLAIGPVRPRKKAPQRPLPEKGPEKAHFEPAVRCFGTDLPKDCNLPVLSCISTSLNALEW